MNLPRKPESALLKPGQRGRPAAVQLRAAAQPAAVLFAALAAAAGALALRGVGARPRRFSPAFSPASPALLREQRDDLALFPGLADSLDALYQLRDEASLALKARARAAAVPSLSG